MHYQFTPAAQRALVSAAAWTSSPNAAALEPPEVLLGLLAEPECRAALLLASYGIDEASITRRWAGLSAAAEPDLARAERFSPAVARAFDAAEVRLFEYPRPLLLASEHLLLGLAATDDELAAWLKEMGLDVDQLEAEVHRHAGHQPGPLSVDLPDTPAAGPLPPPVAGAAELHGILRIIDAAANRAGEGLRVIEDYVRFVLDDPHLTHECKQLRHELTDALTAIPVADRNAARDVDTDVGASITVPAEQARSSAAHVVVASFKRTEQALRSLEEYAKTITPLAAERLERIRYRLYVLEQAVTVAGDAFERLAGVQLYVLLDGRSSAAEFQSLVGTLLEAGVDAIQLRDKSLTDPELLERARLLRQMTRGGALCIVNDRPDIAALAACDGVHLGQADLSPKDARTVLGPAIIGMSTHSIEQARSAVAAGASYIGVGPTFRSATKEFTDFTGIELLAQVRAEIRLPAFAIGGVTLENLPQVIAAGFARVAVQSAIGDADDPRAAAEQFLQMLRSAAESTKY